MSNAAEMVACRKLVSLILAKDCVISVHDGEEWALKQSHDLAAIVEAASATEESVLKIRKNGEVLGVVTLVWGNAPDELICDHSDNDQMNALYKAWIDSLEG